MAAEETGVTSGILQHVIGHCNMLSTSIFQIVHFSFLSYNSQLYM